MTFVVSRYRGLGDTLMLLPVLLKAVHLGHTVMLVTRGEWVAELTRWAPGIEITADVPDFITHDLDQMTKNSIPRTHRTLEFGEMLGIPGPFPLIRQTVPRDESSLAHGSSDAILFAPEAGHLARQWPAIKGQQLCSRFRGSPLILVGLDRSTDYEADDDLRGQLSLGEMFDVVSRARLVISMDSGMLQVAMALATPVIALFGGISPEYRVLPTQRALILVGSSTCRPCNKIETCYGRYDCISEISVGDVVRATSDIAGIHHRVIRFVGERRQNAFAQ